jgi:hypothetical protein
MEQSTYIIFMTNGFFKIGKSNNPKKRIATLKTANPMIAESFIILPENHENYLHLCFSKFRINREWFLFGYNDKTMLTEHIEFIYKMVVIALSYKKEYENPTQKFNQLLKEL